MAPLRPLPVLPSLELTPSFFLFRTRHRQRVSLSRSAISLYLSLSLSLFASGPNSRLGSIVLLLPWLASTRPRLVFSSIITVALPTLRLSSLSLSLSLICFFFFPLLLVFFSARLYTVLALALQSALLAPLQSRVREREPSADSGAIGPQEHTGIPRDPLPPHCERSEAFSGGRNQPFEPDTRRNSLPVNIRTRRRLHGIPFHRFSALPSILDRGSACVPATVLSMRAPL